MLTTNEEAIAVQRRIIEAVRAVSDDDAQGIAKIIVDSGPSYGTAVILAATRNPAIQDALRNLWQCWILEDRPVHEKHLRPTNPNPETDQ